MTATRIQTRSGLSLVADVEGAGAMTVILAHGGGQTRHSWRGLSAALVRHGYRVIRFDLRGHGESEWATDGDYFLPAMAEDLTAVVDHAQGRVALVGASLGGLASFYALGSGIERRPVALALVDIALRPARDGTARVRAFMDAHPDGFASLEEAGDAVAGYSGRARPKSSDGLRRNLRQGADGRWRWHWDPRFLRQADELVERSHLLLSVAPAIPVPVRLLRGGESDMVTDEAVAEMAAAIPDFSVEVVAGAGHMVAGTANDPYADAIVAFLKDVEASACVTP
ncbi:MAG: alpha/beta hydrolase [Sphingomonas bacterium]